MCPGHHLQKAQPLLCSAKSDTVLNLMVATWLLLLWAPNLHSRQEEEGFVPAETIPFGGKARQQASFYIAWSLLAARGPDSIYFSVGMWPFQQKHFFLKWSVDISTFCLGHVPIPESLTGPGRMGLLTPS